jgi:hypothetical protein
MSATTNTPQTARAVVKWLRCRRTGQMRTVAEHAACPYCWGKVEDIGRGAPYAAFCDYDAARDPIHFGFRLDSSRYRHG